MSAKHASPPPRHEPQLLRFGLRQMFVFVTLMGVLSALIAMTRGPWPWVIVGGALLVGAHVVGNLIGTRLRESSDELRRWRESHPHYGPDNPVTTSEPYDSVKSKLPPETTLASFADEVRWLTWILIAGFVVGAIVGGTLLMIMVVSRIGWAGWTVGTISTGVLGVWAAFVSTCFTKVTRTAWRQANEKC